MADYYGHASAAGPPGPPPKRAAPPPQGALDQGKIFVGGLSWQTTEESLRWHFEQFGPVASVEVMKDRVTGDPRGFAFVVFQDADTVDVVMDAGAHEINHKVVDVKRAQARGVAPPSIHRGGPAGGEGGGAQDDPNNSNNASAGGGRQQFGAGHAHNKNSHFRNNNNNNNQDDSSGLTPEQLHNKVFVGGLPAHVDKEELKNIFEQFGPVADAIVMVDQVTNRSRCFGFVTFENDGSNGAQKSIDAQPLQVGNRSVEVKLATPKAEQNKHHNKTPAAAGPKHVGLRAGMSSTTSSGEFAGLAVSYGRSGWRAGYGTKAFGAAGWAVEGWDQGGSAPERSGFSFELLRQRDNSNMSSAKHRPHRDHRDGGPPMKRARH